MSLKDLPIFLFMNGDKLKTIKKNLENIIKDGVNYYKFYNTIAKANDLYFTCNHFVSAYVLYCFETNMNFPNLDKDFFSMAFKAISKKSCGPKPKGENLNLVNNLDRFFSDKFVDVLKEKNNKTTDFEMFKLSSTNLSYIVGCYTIQMETMFKNNVVLNFFKYVHQYVNCHFIKNNVGKKSRKEFKKLSDEDKRIYLSEKQKESEENKLIRDEIMKVKNDLCNNVSEDTYSSHQKYHKWINNNKDIIFPKIENNLSYEDDIKVNYSKYLKHMLLMNAVLEKNNKKMFMALPLRTELYDKYVTFNTAAIRDIFGEVNSALTNAQVWEKYFNINYKPNRKNKINENDNKLISLNRFHFNEQISTDGVAVSISLIREDQIEVKKLKSERKSKASINSRKMNKNFTNEERGKFQNDKKEEVKKEKFKKMQFKKEITKKNKEIFKNLPDKEKEKKRLEIKLNNNKIEYIEDAVKDETYRKFLLQCYEKNRLIVDDPGSRSKGSFLGKGKQSKNGSGQIRDDNIFFSYTSQRSIKETKRLKYMKKIDDKKHETGIKEGEKCLAKLNSKTVDFNKFIEFAKIKINLRKKYSSYEKVKMKEELNEKVNNLKQEIYEIRSKLVKNPSDEKIFKDVIVAETNKLQTVNELKSNENCVDMNNHIRKLKWFGYINKRRSEDKFLNELEEIYGKKAIIIIGDWSGKGKIRRISMPCMGTRKLLSKRFKTFLINEYNSSKLCYKTEKEGKNLIAEAKDKDGNLKYNIKLHSVITFEMGENNVGCINRDYNATKNFAKQVESLVTTGKKAECFTQKLKQPPMINTKKEKVITLKKENNRGKGCKKAFTDLKRIKRQGTYKLNNP